MLVPKHLKRFLARNLVNTGSSRICNAVAVPVLEIPMVVLSECLSKHLAMKAGEGVKVKPHTFLTPALDEVSDQIHAPAGPS
jgi:hypothetical protein